MDSPSEIPDIPDNQVRLSPDGRWAWDGHNWAPVPLAALTPPPGQPVQPRRGFWSWFGNLFVPKPSWRKSSPGYRRFGTWSTVAVIAMYVMVMWSSRIEHLWHRLVAH